MADRKGKKDLRNTQWNQTVVIIQTFIYIRKQKTRTYFFQDLSAAPETVSHLSSCSINTYFPWSSCLFASSMSISQLREDLQAQSFSLFFINTYLLGIASNFLSISHKNTNDSDFQLENWAFFWTLHPCVQLSTQVFPLGFKIISSTYVWNGALNLYHLETCFLQFFPLQ
jgi:hypothetical protein